MAGTDSTRGRTQIEGIMKSIWGQSERYLRINRASIDVSPGIARMLVIGLIVLVTAIFVAGDVGLWNLWRAQKTLDVLEDDISALESEISCMRKDIGELESDPFAIERVAREKYGYMRYGERVYRIITLSPIDKTGRRVPTVLDNRDATP